MFTCESNVDSVGNHETGQTGGRDSTVQVLSDMLLLSRAARQALVDGEQFEWMPAGQVDVRPIASHKRTGKVDLRPSTAREVALGRLDGRDPRVRDGRRLHGGAPALR